MNSDFGGFSVLQRWTEKSSAVFKSVPAAIQAAVAAFRGALTKKTGNSHVERIEPGEDLPEWRVMMSEAQTEKLVIGDFVHFSKPITDSDVRQFAAVSGDTNPLHLEPQFVEKTRFTDRIAPALLASSLLSAALARFPGVALYLSQDLEFHTPIEIGDRLTAVCEIAEELGDDTYRITTQIKNADEKTVIDGEAVVLIEDVGD